MRFRRQTLAGRGRAPRAALVAGVGGGRTEIAPPPDIVGDQESASVVSGAEDFEIVTVDELRGDPTRAHRIVA